MSAVRSCFFTRRSGRAEACGRLLPSPDNGGLTSASPTRRPFVKMWVKAETWRTPQDTVKSNEKHYSRAGGGASIGKRRFCSIWKVCIKKLRLTSAAFPIIIRLGIPARKHRALLARRRILLRILRRPRRKRLVHQGAPAPLGRRLAADASRSLSKRRRASLWISGNQTAVYLHIDVQCITITAGSSLEKENADEGNVVWRSSCKDELRGAV